MSISNHSAADCSLATTSTPSSVVSVRFSTFGVTIPESTAASYMRFSIASISTVVWGLGETAAHQALTPKTASPQPTTVQSFEARA